MSSSENVSLAQVLPAVVVDRLETTLKQMAQRLNAMVLTGEADWQSEEHFLLVVSSTFSALLRTQPEHAGFEAIRLTFEPEPIADYLAFLRRLAPLQPQIIQTPIQLQPNDPALQSEFTLQLLSVLTDSTATSHAVLEPLTERTLQQQIEQEQLLNQVITQIRQSLELPEILQTAVNRVQQCLQVDRLVIYQLYAQPNHSFNTNTGAVVYEARSANIPSAMHLADTLCLQATPMAGNPERWSLAIEDVESHYTHIPCLLNFLRQAEVRAKLVAPIWVGQSLWGLLIAHQCGETRSWQPSEQRFLGRIAEHLSIAISQAQLYAQVQWQKQTLEQQVIDRTRDLQEALLTAQAASRSKSEFLAAVSHELRTPLTCIIGMSATLQRWSDSLNDRQQGFLQSIHDSGKHLLTLINDILDFSQAEAGRMLLNLGKFSLSRSVQQVLKTFEAEAILHDIELELDLRIDPQCDQFTADPRRLHQILFNLLSNAIKFTPPKGKVTLRVFSDAQGATFQVKDTGIGIPEDQIPLLFQKFQQLDAAYHRQYEGTGLGLALTRQLVELHGGSIQIESTEGVGSVFTVRLPQQSSVVDTSMRQIPPEQTLGRIVLVQHNEELANLICNLLTAAGYHVVWILEGSAAIASIEVLQPVAVMIEDQLPDIDSDHLIHCLRQNPTTKQAKLLILASEASARSNWQHEADACLNLPLRSEQLLQTLSVLTADRVQRSIEAGGS